eukprot:3847052-Lingulodinium_polyedra.AAC.1
MVGHIFVRQSTDATCAFDLPLLAAPGHFHSPETTVRAKHSPPAPLHCAPTASMHWHLRADTS